MGLCYEVILSLEDDHRSILWDFNEVNSIYWCFPPPKIKQNLIRAAAHKMCNTELKENLYLKVKLVLKTLMKHNQKPAFYCSKRSISAFQKHCWHCRHSFQAVLDCSGATNWSQLQSAEWKRVCVCILTIYHLCYQHMTNIYPDLITIHLLMPQRCRVWLFIILNKHVVLNKRMHTVGIWNAPLLLSESVTCESRGARRRLLSTQEICWCRCLPKCVQYASLNHKVTI